jgi:ABC-2 type transport system ATP-binding protein
VIPILEIKNITKRYAAHLALNDISLTVPSGTIYGLLGPNGAGKTSLIRLITQITAADEGSILFKGEPLNPGHVTRIGYLPEERGLYKKMEVGDQLMYFARLKGLGEEEAMEKLRYWVERFSIKAWWKKKVEELSKGMQQKVQFIATVLHAPDLLILDEPFSGFDPVNAGIITEEILELKTKGCSVILSTHRMESVEQLCDHIALIHKSKKVLEGPVRQVREDFRPHLYELTYSGNPILTAPGYSIVNTGTIGDNLHKATIRLDHLSSNEFLSRVLPHAEVHSFSEHLPGMAEIFIKVAGE